MATRFGRRAEPDISSLTQRDRLILAQAVYKHGTDWAAIAKLLSKHPLLAHPKAFFTAQSCQSMYANLLSDAELESTSALQLVQKHYATHFDQLRTLILAEEDKFKSVVQDIERIRAKSIKQESEEPAKAEEEEAPESSDDEPLHATRTRAARQRASKIKGKQKINVDVEMEDATSGIDTRETESPAPEATGPTRRSKRKASVLDTPETAVRDRKRARDFSESANDEEAASSAARVRRKTDPEVKRFQSIILPLHSRISTLKDGNIFQSPIKASEAPDYHDIVKRPIDLRTIKARVKDGIITNSSEYRRDVYLMFANAIMYNRPGSSVYRMAENMRDESDPLINDFRNTEATLLHRI